MFAFYLIACKISLFGSWCQSAVAYVQMTSCVFMNESDISQNDTVLVKARCLNVLFWRLFLFWVSKFSSEIQWTWYKVQNILDSCLRLRHLLFMWIIIHLMCLFVENNPFSISGCSQYQYGRSNIDGCLSNLSFCHAVPSRNRCLPSRTASKHAIHDFLGQALRAKAYKRLPAFAGWDWCS